jgi:hypothetical protein
LACLLTKKIDSKVEFFKFYDSSFKSPHIQNFEFDHFHQIVESKSNWKRIYVGSDTEICSHSLEQFIPHSNIFQKVKMELLCEVLFSFKTRFELNTNATFYGILDIMNQKDENNLDATKQSVISELHLKFPFPMNTPRKCVQVESIKRYKDKIVLLNRPYIEENFNGVPDRWSN